MLLDIQTILQQNTQKKKSQYTLIKEADIFQRSIWLKALEKSIRIKSKEKMKKLIREYLRKAKEDLMTISQLTLMIWTE